MSLLSQEDKQLAVREAYRVLRGGGELHIADFGPPHTWWGHWVAPLLRRFERIADHLDGRLPALFREAGFENVEEAARFAPSSARSRSCLAENPIDLRSLSSLKPCRT